MPGLLDQDAVNEFGPGTPQAAPSPGTQSFTPTITEVVLPDLPPGTVYAGGQLLATITAPAEPAAPPTLPPPSVAPPVEPPALPPPAPPEAAPPIEGEHIPGPGSNPRTIFEDYGDLPYDPEDPANRGYRPIIEGERTTTPPRIGRPGRAPDLPIPPWIGGLPRGVIGGLGGIIIGATFPEPLGSGELPFPPIPSVDIPLPEISPDVQLPPLPEPPAPVFSAPPAPDVVVVTPTGELPQPEPQTVSSPAPSSRIGPGAIIGTILGGLLAPRLTPRRRTVPTPDQFVNPFTNTPPSPDVQPLPNAPPLPRLDPLTPPAGEFLPGTTPTPTPTGLTMPQPLVADSGTPQITDPTRTSECNCEDPGQRRKQRKKPRKCLTRANLIWAGGPKSGKPAGSRCIKFEDYLP